MEAHAGGNTNDSRNAMQQARVPLLPARILRIRSQRIWKRPRVAISRYLQPNWRSATKVRAEQITHIKHRHFNMKNLHRYLYELRHKITHHGPFSRRFRCRMNSNEAFFGLRYCDAPKRPMARSARKMLAALASLARFARSMRPSTAAFPRARV